MQEKNYKMLIELIAKKKTPMGAIGISESVKIMKDFGKLAEKHKFDCYAKGYPADKLEHEPTGKTYKIKTVEDVAKLTSTQFEFFIDDLRTFCDVMRNLQALQDVDLIKVKSKKGMDWIDDGLNQGNVEATIQTSNKL